MAVASIWGFSSTCSKSEDVSMVNTGKLGEEGIQGQKVECIHMCSTEATPKSLLCVVCCILSSGRLRGQIMFQ